MTVPVPDLIVGTTVGLQLITFRSLRFYDVTQIANDSSLIKIS